jgi:hypothetical protein
MSDTAECAIRNRKDAETASLIAQIQELESPCPCRYKCHASYNYRIKSLKKNQTLEKYTSIPYHHLQTIYLLWALYAKSMTASLVIKGGGQYIVWGAHDIESPQLYSS